MESIGEFFRQVRETKGLTLLEVAAKTRIQARFLEALEGDNFAQLPEEVFAKGFVRAYAKSLGVDEDEAISRFTQFAGDHYEKALLEKRSLQRQVHAIRQHQTQVRSLIIGVGSVIFLIIALIGREHSFQFDSSVGSDLVAPPSLPTSPLDAASTSTPSAQGSAAIGSDPIVNSSEPPLVLTPESTPNVKAVEPVTGGVPLTPLISKPSRTVPALLGRDTLIGGDRSGGSGVTDNPLILILEAIELSWVIVQIDGGSPQESLLRRGERMTWNAREQFVLTLGNAGGVTAELNGKPLQAFGPRGQVVREILLKR